MVILSLLLIAFIVFIAMGPFYVLQEGQQAAITRFGEMIKTEEKAGLKFRMPVVDNVVKFPTKIMSWDGDAQRIPTKENQFIWVDTTARWKITNLQTFYESIANIDRAYSRLDDVIDSAVKNVVSTNPLLESVRNSNVINEIDRTSTESEEMTIIEDLGSQSELKTYENITKGRSALSEEMLEKVADITEEQFGIRVIDVVIRQIRYSDDLTESVYSRMIAERRQKAEQYRSYGQGKKQEILGQLDRKKDEILSDAYAKSETIKGQGDAQAANIYALAYGQDPSFTEFWLALESYKKTMGNFNKTLTTDMDYFQYLYSPDGR